MDTEVKKLLTDIGLEHAIPDFSKHRIKFNHLNLLTEQEITELLPIIGDRQDFKDAIKNKTTDPERHRPRRRHIVDMEEDDEDGSKRKKKKENNEERIRTLSTDEIRRNDLFNAAEETLKKFNEELFEKKRRSTPGWQLINLETGKLNCPFCSTPIAPQTASDTKKTWKLNNLDRHLINKHSDLKYASDVDVDVNSFLEIRMDDDASTINPESNLRIILQRVDESMTSEQTDVSADEGGQASVFLHENNNDPTMEHQNEMDIEDEALIEDELLVSPYNGATSNIPSENNEESTMTEHAMKEVSSSNQDPTRSTSTREVGENDVLLSTEQKETAINVTQDIGTVTQAITGPANGSDTGKPTEEVSAADIAVNLNGTTDNGTDLSSTIKDDKLAIVAPVHLLLTNQQPEVMFNCSIPLETIEIGTESPVNTSQTMVKHDTPLNVTTGFTTTVLVDTVGELRPYESMPVGNMAVAIEKFEEMDVATNKATSNATSENDEEFIVTERALEKVSSSNQDPTRSTSTREVGENDVLLSTEQKETAINVTQDIGTVTQAITGPANGSDTGKPTEEVSAADIAVNLNGTTDNGTDLSSTIKDDKLAIVAPLQLLLTNQQPEVMFNCSIPLETIEIGTESPVNTSQTMVKHDTPLNVTTGFTTVLVDTVGELRPYESMPVGNMAVAIEKFEEMDVATNKATSNATSENDEEFIVTERALEKVSSSNQDPTRSTPTKEAGENDVLLSTEQKFTSSTSSSVYENKMEIIQCICGLFTVQGPLIKCTKCMVWQHIECIGSSDAEGYLCERCDNRVVDLEIPLNEYSEEGYRYYLTLMRGDLQVRQSDTVYVLRDIPISPDTESTPTSTVKKHTYKTIGKIEYTTECDIFRVEHMWKDHEGNRFIFGHNYLRPYETYHERTRKFYQNEVVQVPLREMIPIDLVMGRCWVLDTATFCKGKPVDSEEGHIYICELRVNKAATGFQKIAKKYDVCMKPYAFTTFPKKLKIFRNYSPHQLEKLPMPKKKEKKKGQSRNARKN